MDKVLILSVGGAGCQIAGMIHKRLGGRVVAVNTDPDGLKRCELPEHLHIGIRGQATERPRPAASARRAAEALSAQFVELLHGIGLLVLAAGLGGGAGTGATPVIAEELAEAVTQRRAAVKDRGAPV